MPDRISKEVMEQYEEVRSLGPCNMFDFGCVQQAADELEFYELANLDRKDYVYILSNFGKLMKHYNIK